MQVSRVFLVHVMISANLNVCIRAFAEFFLTKSSHASAAAGKLGREGGCVVVAVGADSLAPGLSFDINVRVSGPYFSLLPITSHSLALYSCGPLQPLGTPTTRRSRPNAPAALKLSSLPCPSTLKNTRSISTRQVTALCPILCSYFGLPPASSSRAALKSIFFLR